MRGERGKFLLEVSLPTRRAGGCAFAAAQQFLEFRPAILAQIFVDGHVMSILETVIGRVLFFLAGSVGAMAQGTVPKHAAAEYAVHVEGPVTFGAEYLVHSVPLEKGVLLASEYLVVEVAVFPATHGQVDAHAGDFALRINGKQTLLPESAGMAGASMKYPEWQDQRRVEASVGNDTGSVTLGGPQDIERFPGDPRSKGNAGMDAAPTERVDRAVARLALPEGPTSNPVSGYLYFPFRGKTTKIRTIELYYKGKAGEATLKFY